jgi:hypothetical protein
MVLRTRRAVPPHRRGEARQSPRLCEPVAVQGQARLFQVSRRLRLRAQELSGKGGGDVIVERDTRDSGQARIPHDHCGNRPATEASVCSTKDSGSLTPTISKRWGSSFCGGRTWPSTSSFCRPGLPRAKKVRLEPFVHPSLENAEKDRVTPGPAGTAYFEDAFA